MCAQQKRKREREKLFLCELHKTQFMVTKQPSSPFPLPFSPSPTLSPCAHIYQFRLAYLAK
jgi:hypothetical protein